MLPAAGEAGAFQTAQKAHGRPGDCSRLENARSLNKHGLTPREQKENMSFCRQQGSPSMSATPSLSDNSHYEQACDQAIAMCDGNLRSTIKALIMVNEYLETELEELQAAVSAGRVPGKRSNSNAA
jgi:hypothetical protein